MENECVRLPSASDTGGKWQVEWNWQAVLAVWLGHMSGVWNFVELLVAFPNLLRRQKSAAERKSETFPPCTIALIEWLWRNWRLRVVTACEQRMLLLLAYVFHLRRDEAFEEGKIEYFVIKISISTYIISEWSLVGWSLFRYVAFTGWPDETRHQEEWVSACAEMMMFHA